MDLHQWFLVMARGVSAVTLTALGCLGCSGPSPTDAGPAGLDAGTVCLERECVFDPFALLIDPYLPARMLPGRARLVSSRQPEPPEAEGNFDFNNFARVESDGTRVLMEADGPGVITRLWFTGRQPLGQIYEVLDETTLHMEIDGAEVAWIDGESGVSLAVLTSGALPGFEHPWVAGRDTASNAFLVHVPLAFADSIRVWIDEPPGIDTTVFYQIDWRQLPVGYVVEPFDGTLTADQADAIHMATQVWLERSVSAPAATSTEARAIAPGGMAVVTLGEPTTVRGISVEMVTGALSDVEAELFVDGVSAVEGPLVQWSFATPPTVPHDSALATVGATALTFRYPFPVRDSVEIRLRNVSPAEIRASLTVAHDPGIPDGDLAALRASCGSALTPMEGENLRVVELAGRRGHYAGQFLVVRSANMGFYVLEGDHEIATDGERLLGTGLEDYFGGSYYYERGPFVLPLSGASYRSEIDGVNNPQVSQYRHHFLDTVPFDSAFRFEYESFLADSTFGYCLFWYEAL